MEKKKIILIIVICILVVGLGIGAFFLFKHKEETPNNTTNEIEDTTKRVEDLPEEQQKEIQELKENLESGEADIDCTKKGNVCSIVAIGKGIPMDIKVNATETYKFHVIANDEDTLTLLSDDAILTTKWSEYDENFFGPIKLLEDTFAKTSTWTNLKPLNFEYEDFGNKLFNENCKSGSMKYCEIAKNGIGYKNIVMNNTNVTLNNSYGENLVISNKPVYARPVTFDEISYLNGYNKKIEWLAGAKEFWTMSSLVDEGYIFRAAYTAKASNITDSGIEGFNRVITSDYDVRVVITIDK